MRGIKNRVVPMHLDPFSGVKVVPNASDYPVSEQRHWSPRCLRPDGLVAPRPVEIDRPLRPNQEASPGLSVQTDLVRPLRAEHGRLRHRRTTHLRARAPNSQLRCMRRLGRAALAWSSDFDGTKANGGELPVPLLVGNNPLQPDKRVHIDRCQIAPTERVCTGGIWITTVQRALFDVMRYSANVRDAVVAMDMTAAARLISVSLMSLYVVERSGWTGVPLVREALALATNESRSPQESRMRLVWVIDAGLAPPLCNVPDLRSLGSTAGGPDLFDPIAGVAGEYDGVDHKSQERHRADVAREGLLRRHGLECFTVVGGDLTDRTLVVKRMHETRDRALFQSSEARSWTLVPPPWWKPREEPLDIHLARIGEAPYLYRCLKP